MAAGDPSVQGGLSGDLSNQPCFARPIVRENSSITAGVSMTIGAKIEAGLCEEGKEKARGQT